VRVSSPPISPQKASPPRSELLSSPLMVVEIGDEVISCFLKNKMGKFGEKGVFPPSSFWREMLLEWVFCFISGFYLSVGLNVWAGVQPFKAFCSNPQQNK